MNISFNDCEDCPYSDFQSIPEKDYMVCWKSKKFGRVKTVFNNCPFNEDFFNNNNDTDFCMGSTRNVPYSFTTLQNLTSIADFEDSSSSYDVEDDDEIMDCLSCKYFTPNISDMFWCYGLEGKCKKGHNMSLKFNDGRLRYSKKNCFSYQSNNEKFTVKHDFLWFCMKYCFIAITLLIIIGFILGW